MFHRASKLALVFALALTASCTCVSAEVRNNTGQPVFANTAFYDNGQLVEEEGVLLDADGKFEFPIYGNGTFIRVRDLSGNTIAFQRAKDDDDSTFDISSIEPAGGAAPLGEIATGDIGPTKWFVCGDEKDGIRLFGTTVSIRSEYADPLIISLVEDWRRSRQEKDIRGVLLPAGGSAEVYGMIVERGWLRAVNARGDLVYVRVVPKLETSQVTIPATPSDIVEPIGSFECA